MEVSLFLAQLFGLTLVVFILIALLRPVFLEAALRDLRPYSFPLLIAGFVGIIGGLAVILSHNVWEMSWRVIITIFGWAALAKGVMYVAFPEYLLRTAGKVLGDRCRTPVLLIALLFGIYLTYQGFYGTA
ncbi:hypothetical protein KC906_03440 [Candidatus Kaiserbacteria bacterium]|nr:hypothetical protein [Candidatus Kaiserbacteria bacterium]MCB9812140.1 hypothetical protein [Candidatus Nomurabacteria bacterium]